MRKNVKSMLVAGTVLCAVGVSLFAAGAVTGGITYAREADLNKMDGRAKYQGSTVMEKTKIERLDRIEAEFGTTDLEILPSGDENYYLACRFRNAEEAGKLKYAVEDGCLKLSDKSGKVRLMQIDLSFLSWLFGGRAVDAENKVTLYVPETALFENSKIRIDDGDLTMEGFSGKNTELELHYGDLTLKDCSLDGAAVTSSDGSMEGEGLVLSDAEMSFHYGDVEWEAVSLKDSSVRLSDGDLEAEELEVQGELEIQDSYGDVTLQLAKKCREALSMDLRTSYGEIELDGELGRTGRFVEQDDRASYERTGQADGGLLKLELSDGDIEVR